MLLLVGLALAVTPEAAVSADCDPATVVDELVASGRRDAYLCLAGAENGKDLILGAIAKDPLGEHNRLTRALVLWLLERTDRPMDPDLVARLSPADRRLLADGIRARRGRASPSPEHAAVFTQVPWYAPMPGYTDARLRPIDRANLDIVDPAVRLTPPPAEGEAGDEGEEEAAAAPAAPDRVGADTPNLCGCASAAAPSGAFGLGAGALVVLLGAARRRR